MRDLYQLSETLTHLGYRLKPIAPRQLLEIKYDFAFQNCPMAALEESVSPRVGISQVTAKWVIVFFVVERVIRVDLRHRRRLGFAISV